MSIGPGSRVGPYDVVAPLGAGGMGEVFRARDARLKRDVALKLLPAAAASDPDRRARFEREAQVLASLNHNNVAHIFGIEVHGEAPVIVMELVEGPTLAERLAEGALPLDDALSIATQISEGLDAAHERGIVHRDLKPANIKLLPEGTVKILDFGLARVLSDDARPDAANSPTVTVGRTELGLILGTAAYMSPEQARGQAVDKRADIWAFGCIVYEMLTGTPAFGGDSATDILADVVRVDPEWSRIPASVPPSIVDVLRRCVQKNPRDRWRDIADVRIALERARRGGASSASFHATVPPPRASWRAIGWFAAGMLVAALAAALTLYLRRDDAVLPPPVRSTVTLPPETTLALGRGSAVALSPDGRTLAFVGRVKSTSLLFLRALDRFESQLLPGTEGATNPFFSPDGRWVGFFAEGKVKKVSVDGGAPVTVADAPNPRGEAWGADDTIFVTRRNSEGVSRVPANGGALEPFTKLREGELSHRWPRLLPDGRTMLFAIWNDAGWEPSRIAVKRSDTADHTTVIEAGGGYPRYIRDAGQDGFLVYARSEGLLAVRFRETSLSVTGQAVPVVDGVLTNLSGGAHFDLSSSGTLAYAPGALLAEGNRELVWVARDGKPVSDVIRMPELTQTWRLAPDGRRLVRNGVTGRGDIWLEDLVSRQPTMAVTNSRQLGNFNAIWVPDGRTIVFARGFSTSNLFQRAADGSGEETQLTTGAKPRVPASVSPDGKWLLFYEIDPVTGFDLWVMPLPPPATGGEAPGATPFVKTNATEVNASFSPDGRWIAYQSNDGGRFDVLVRSFPDGQRVLRASTEGGLFPAWSPAGNELFYRGVDNRMMVITFAAGQFGQPRVLFDALNYDDTYAVSPDGQRLLMMPLLRVEQSATQINLVQNFLTELRQRVR